MGRHAKISPEKQAEAATALLAGTPAAELSAVYGVSRVTLHSYLRQYAKEHGIQSRIKRGPMPGDVPELQAIVAAQREHIETLERRLAKMMLLLSGEKQGA